MSYRGDYPASNPAGHSPRYSVRNPENYLGGHPASYRTGYLPENPASSREDCLHSNSADYSADCSGNRRERNPENNLESNGAGYSESYSVDSLPNCSASYLESFDPRPVCREAAGARLLQLDNLADGLCLSLRLGFSYKVHARCQPPHIVGARCEVYYLPPADVEQRACGLRFVTCGLRQEQDVADGRRMHTVARRPEIRGVPRAVPATANS